MENTNSLINTVAALGVDITYSNGNLNIAVDSGTFPQMYVPQIESFTKITGVAETSQTSTVTYTVANSTTYEFTITQDVNAPNQAPVTYTATYTSDASATGAEIATNLVNQINAQTGDTGIKVTASGAASPLTLTADAGFPFFTAAAVSNVTIAAGVTGVAAKGIGADLITAGVAGAVAGTTYTTYIFDFYSNQPAQMGAELNAGLNTMTLYVNQGDADFTQFDALLLLIVTPNSQDKYAQRIDHTTAAINATATATAAEVATGYITSTSGAATTITLPTGTLLGAELGAKQGTIFDLYIDNTAGANPVTIAVGTNMILSTAAADSAGSFGDLTVANGVTGVARYTIMFSSATAAVFTRTA